MLAIAHAMIVEKVISTITPSTSDARPLMRQTRLSRAVKYAARDDISRMSACRNCNAAIAPDRMK
jgi:hypothetical protein